MAICCRADPKYVVVRAKLAGFLASGPEFFRVSEKWCAQGDDFRTFLAEFVSSLPPTDLLTELAL
jgi:hypothetical protein